MFYSGGDFTLIGRGDGGRQEKGLLVRPGLALSQDGRNWARVEGDHHTGALFDVGPKGSFDAGGVSEPNVRFAPRRFAQIAICSDQIPSSVHPQTLTPLYLRIEHSAHPRSYI